MRPYRVLLIEDDRDLSNVLRLNLEAVGYTVLTAFEGSDGVRSARNDNPDLVILDIMLPGIDGFEVLDLIRRDRPDVPALMLTARRQMDDKVFAFKIGADDYLTKPFGIQELTLRVAALLRRASRPPAVPAPATPSVLREGPVEVRLAGRTVLCNGVRVDLTPKAFDLLVALLVRRGETVSRVELLRRIWSYADGVTSRTLDAHVAELRRRLERHPRNPELLHTVWKVGYRCAYEPHSEVSAS
jgi:DNA-binding response OmpR family regulator